MDRFRDKQTAEAYYIEWDFSTISASLVLASAVVSAVVNSTGVDVTTTITTAASQTISGSSVYTWVKAGTSGIDYKLTCLATATDGSIYELEGLMLVKDVPLTLTASTGPGRVIPPTIEPISLAELKSHLLIDHSDSDDVLSSNIIEAREYVEDITGRALLTQTWDYCLQDWPDGDRIKLPYGNLQSVTSIKYKNEVGTETTLTATTDYLVGVNGDQCGYIFLPNGVSWPDSDLYPYNPITIRFVCGWTSAALVPFKIKAAIKLIAADLYQNREDKVISNTTYVSYAQNDTARRLLRQSTLWDTF